MKNHLISLLWALTTLTPTMQANKQLYELELYKKKIEFYALEESFYFPLHRFKKIGPSAIDEISAREFYANPNVPTSLNANPAKVLDTKQGIHALIKIYDNFGTFDAAFHKLSVLKHLQDDNRQYCHFPKQNYFSENEDTYEDISCVAQHILGLLQARREKLNKHLL